MLLLPQKIFSFLRFAAVILLRNNKMLISFFSPCFFPAEYPWQVAILRKEKLDNVYLCGGSLIDGSHVLTAAHCVKDYRPEQLRIRLGEWDVNNDSEFYTHAEFDATNLFVHEKFYEGNLYNDLAMIRLGGYVDYARK